MSTVLGAKRKTRTFRLQISLGIPEAVKWAEEVIENIEHDELLVYRPDDNHALDWQTNENGDIQIETRATLPVSIKEWLPIACQLIEWRAFTDQETLGMYRHNANEVLWPVFPYGDAVPQGPSAFTATIGLRNEWLDDSDEAWFKGLVAHELVHALDSMRFFVPAFLDWKAFWTHMLDSGSSCDTLRSQWSIRSQFVDSYAEPLELAELKRYWPSSASTWFEGFNAKWRML